MPFSVEEWAQTRPAIQEFVLSLLVRVQALEAEVAVLREQLNRDSGNSSQPIRLLLISSSGFIPERLLFGKVYGQLHSPSRVPTQPTPPPPDDLSSGCDLLNVLSQARNISSNWASQSRSDSALYD